MYMYIHVHVHAHTHSCVLSLSLSFTHYFSLSFTHSLFLSPHRYSYSSSQSEESFSENSLPRDVSQRKRLFRNHSHSMSFHPTPHRRTLSAHEYEEDSDDKPPPQALTAVGGVARGGARGGYSSDLISYKNPLRERFTEGR